MIDILSKLKIFTNRKIIETIFSILISKSLVHKNNHSKIAMLKPNSCVRGITELDESKFDKTVTVPCIITSGTKLSDILPGLKRYLLKLPKFKPIEVEIDKTVIVLNPDEVSCWSDINVDIRKNLEKCSIKEDNFIFREQKLTYQNFTVDDVLKAVLPSDQEGSSSFTQIGHIVHVNLREHVLPFKNVIAKVLYDKVQNCKTVVNKVNIIDNTYRNFRMEVLCGDHDLKTKIKQNGCQFELDFSKVYWNSRLSTEHERIIKFIKKGDVVFDVFAGVGPFSIPIAKKECIVYANDLNPESYHWLKHNGKLNKVQEKYFNIFNKDGKDFIIQDIKTNLLKHINANNTHIIMNLPALAIEFLRYFIDLCDIDEISKIEKYPNVYAYCFTKGEDYVQIAKDLISQSLQCDMSDRISLHRVRTVSSLKEMVCITFKLTEDILMRRKNNKRQNSDEEFNEFKKHCHQDEQVSSDKSNKSTK